MGFAFHSQKLCGPEVGTGLACHGYVQPYEDPFLNRLEFGTLLASSAAASEPNFRERVGIWGWQVVGGC